MDDLSNGYNIVMSEIKNLTVAYNPNDFYYYNATFSDGTKINTNNYYNDDNKCNTFLNSTTDCNRTDKKTNLENCYNREVCMNRQNAMKMNQLQTNHDGVDTRNIDVIVDYNRELLKSYNLAIGSLGILAIFYFLYK
jgi:hypothetical protein